MIYHLKDWALELHQFVNILRITQNGHHFADVIFKLIFLYEHCCVFIQISQKFVVEGEIFNWIWIVGENY